MTRKIHKQRGKPYRRRFSFDPVEIDARDDVIIEAPLGFRRQRIDAGAAAVFAAIDRSVSDKRDKRG